MASSILTMQSTQIIDTQYGSFVLDVFPVGGAEVIVLHTEDIPGKRENVLCRIQSECISHSFFEQTCDGSDQIAPALQQIRDVGTGILIYLRQDGMALGISAMLTHDTRD